jgi:hypothetical protein
MLHQIVENGESVADAARTPRQIHDQGPAADAG